MTLTLLSWANGLAVCRNKDKLEELKIKFQKAVFSKADTQTENVRKVDLSTAIDDWRMFLRETKYLSNEDNIVHTSITGQVLDPGLVRFTEESARKRGYRILSMLLDQDMPDDPTLFHPVYVTSQENTDNNSWSKQTIAIIDNKILGLIENFDVDKKAHYLEHFHKNVIKKRKANHIEFYQELLDVNMNESFDGVLDEVSNDDDEAVTTLTNAWWDAKFNT